MMNKLNAPLATLAVGLLLLAGVVLSACGDLLEESPEDFISPGSFYQNEADVMAALNGAYDGLRWYDSGPEAPAIFESPTPDVTTGNGTNSVRGSFDVWLWDATSGYLQGLWSGIYNGINRANAVIGRTAEVEMDEVRKARAIAEARFLRAYHYFTLVRLFGGVPLRLEETRTLDDLQTARSSAEDVYAFLVEELSAIQADLPLISAYEGADKARASKGSAQALLGKVYLQRALDSRVEAQAGDLQSALDQLEAVIASGEYALEGSYADLFYANNERNEETIFALEHMQLGGQGTNSQNFLAPRGSNYGVGQWTSFHGELPFLRSYEEGDPRWEASWLAEYEDSEGNLRVWNPDDLENDGFREDGPSLRKLMYQDADLAYSEGYRDYILLRYADVLLSKAEALNEINGGPTTDAFDALNQVRARAGLEARSDLDYAAFREALFLERRWEFTQEFQNLFDGQRFWDLFKAAVEAAADNADPNVETHPKIDFEIQDHQRLYPIPQGAIDRNALLEQNDGY